MNYLDELKQLSTDNLNGVRVLFEEIDNEFQIKRKPDAIISYLPRHCRPRPSKEKITTEYTQYEYDEVKKRLNSLNFLKDRGVLNGYNVDSSHHRDDGNSDWHIEIKLNTDTFQSFKSSLKKATGKTPLKLAHHEILKLILEVIIQEKELDPDNPFVTLNINLEKNEHLFNVPPEEIDAVLDDLQNKEKILTIQSKNYPDAKTRNFYDCVMNHTVSFVLKIEDSFGNWLDHYIMIKNRKLEDLDQTTLLYMLDLALIIDQKVQLSLTPRLSMDLTCQPKFFELSTLDVISEPGERRLNALNFFKQQGVINYSLVEVRVYGGIDPEYTKAEIVVTVKKWPEFLQRLKSLRPIPQKHTSKATQPKPTQLNEEIAYTVTYNAMTGEILLNDKIIKKTNLGSLVDVIFAYLHKNPDRKITLAELKKATKKDIKDLPKVIENAGFTGNRLKAFFGRVSKDAVYFKPQISKTDLDKLGITSLD